MRRPAHEPAGRTCTDSLERAARPRRALAIDRPSSRPRRAPRYQRALPGAPGRSARAQRSPDRRHGKLAESRVLDCCAAQARVDVLKVAHHGSKTSSTDSFLEEAAPRLALISAGVNNLYHHPSPVILDRLQEHAIRSLRTDRDGMVVLRFREDG